LSEQKINFIKKIKKVIFNLEMRRMQEERKLMEEESRVQMQRFHD
jgi:hypothetical protein